MFNEFYASKKAAIRAEIAQQGKYAALIYSSSSACVKRAKRAIKALERLTAQLEALERAEALEREMWEACGE